MVYGTEIAKRLNAIIGQILPFLSQEHHQQVASAVDRAKQVTMTELNSIIGRSKTSSSLSVPEPSQLAVSTGQKLLIRDTQERIRVMILTLLWLNSHRELLLLHSSPTRIMT
ncbi:hypothetical protein KQX54_007828 [Cotesia glomerata]|uniref:Groucho/TLE N-terminal Q-rich domain-containing protein n=1 Tax=Cotesia glomerata TaxID=32391 RepID=A0AAV7I1P5_COTGL|nr:hypothetical protein KQX54_007828 [Cotesia glomerata]